MRLWRSALITCGLNTWQYGRAAEVGADISTLDWEDAVPPARKEEARRLSLPYLKSDHRGGPLRCVRPNSPRSEEGLRDLLALLESGARLDVLIVPKVESAGELSILAEILGDRIGPVAFLPIIETARGVANVDEIATGPRVAGLILGAADLSTNLDSTMSWEHMYYTRCRIVVAAAANGISAFDSPCFTLDVPQVLLEEIEKSAAMGFTAKIAIHPNHVGPINQGYRPRPAEILPARQGWR